MSSVFTTAVEKKGEKRDDPSKTSSPPTYATRAPSGTKMPPRSLFPPPDYATQVPKGHKSTEQEHPTSGQGSTYQRPIDPLKRSHTAPTQHTSLGCPTQKDRTTSWGGSTSKSLAPMNRAQTQASTQQSHSNRPTGRGFTSSGGGSTYKPSAPTNRDQTRVASQQTRFNLPTENGSTSSGFLGSMKSKAMSILKPVETSRDFLGQTNAGTSTATVKFDGDTSLELLRTGRPPRTSTNHRSQRPREGLPAIQEMENVRGGRYEPIPFIKLDPASVREMANIFGVQKDQIEKWCDDGDIEFDKDERCLNVERVLRYMSLDMCKRWAKYDAERKALMQEAKDKATARGRGSNTTNNGQPVNVNVNLTNNNNNDRGGYGIMPYYSPFLHGRYSGYYGPYSPYYW